jgi:hypothetical protein
VLRIATLFSSLAVLTLSIGCGSVSNNPPATPTPTPVASPTPTPVASPTPTPTPAAAPDAFLSTVFLQAGRVSSTIGLIFVDTSANHGATHLQFTGIGAPNTTLILQFCPYPQADPNLPSCSNVTSLTSDANGNASVNFTFPGRGTFSGEFQIVQTNGALVAATGTDTVGGSFHSALLPAATITGGIQQTTGSAPGSGTIVMNGPDATITLSGTTPSHTFTTAVCSLFPTGPAPAPCIALANVTTDAQGNASVDVGPVQRDLFSIFQVSDSDGVEFLTAFRVQ